MASDRRDRRERRNRMAGDRMKETSEASDLSARDDGYRNSLQRRLGKDEYGRIGAEGLDAADDRGRYNAAEVKSEFRNSDKTVEEMTDYYQGLADEGTKFNQRARDFLSAKGVTFGGGGGGGSGDEDDPVVSIPETPDTPTTPPVLEDPKPTQPPIAVPPGLGTGPGSQTQIVNQDNDAITTVTGNNNTTTVNQDNSVSQYGAYGSADRAKMLRDHYVADVSRFVRA